MDIDIDLLRKAFTAGFSEGYHCEDNPADSEPYFQEFLEVLSNERKR